MEKEKKPRFLPQEPLFPEEKREPPYPPSERGEENAALKGEKSVRKSFPKSKSFSDQNLFKKKKRKYERKEKIPLPSFY